MSQQPIHDLVDEWLHMAEYTPRCTDNYTSILNMFTRWMTEHHDDVRLEDATSRQVREWLDSRTCGSTTLHKNWQALCAFYGWLADADEGPGLIDRSPMKMVKAPKFSQRPKVTMGRRDDFDTFVANTDANTDFDRRARAIIAVAYFAGLRISEVLDLNVGDVTFEGNNIATLYISDPKNNEPRTAVLPPEGVRYVRRYMRYRIGSSAPDAPLMTGTARTKDSQGRLTYAAWNSWLGRYRNRTGHEMPTAHAWRRGGATEMVAAGVDQVHVETLLGWRHDGKMIARYLGEEAERVAKEALIRATAPEGGTEDRRSTRRKARQARRADKAQGLRVVS